MGQEKRETQVYQVTQDALVLKVHLEAQEESEEKAVQDQREPQVHRAKMECLDYQEMMVLPEEMDKKVPKETVVSLATQLKQQQEDQVPSDTLEQQANVEVQDLP